MIVIKTNRELAETLRQVAYRIPTHLYRDIRAVCTAADVIAGLPDDPAYFPPPTDILKDEP